MKHSIRARLMLLLTGLVALAVFACWSMNRMFLSDYYQSSKIKMLGQVYAEVNQNFQEMEQQGAYNPDEISLTLEKLGASQNLSLYVADIYWGNQYNMLFPSPIYIYPERPDEIQKEQIKSRLVEFFLNEDGTFMKRKKELLNGTEMYRIYKINDERTQTNYIELIGIMDNGLFVYMKANYASMQESVDISNKFLAYIGMVVTAISILIMFFISKSFTNPIRLLSGIARRMTNLDFREKYMEKRTDEVGELGNSINILSDRLERTISELKSANNELKTDNDRKTQIDEMRKEFLSNVSHELKTPIALIQGYAEGLKENINDDQDSRDFYCEVIMDEAGKMNQMVKKLLSLNQIEFGNNQIQFEHFDITALIRSIINSSAILLQQKNAVLNMEQKEPIYVWAEEYRIEEVVTNYFSNALNHLDGENQIKIDMKKNGNLLRISVFNTGSRIPDSDLDNIWIKFYKVDKARTREYGGSGIGLSIVKAIMDSMNRSCGVENKENGVEFWFEVDMENDT